MAKRAKSTKKGTRASATRSPAKAESETRATGDRLLGSVWHDGKNYDPKKPADQAAFRDLVKKDKALGDKDKAGKPRAMLDLQRLADEGVVSGFGVKGKTKASKRAKARAEEEADADGEEGADTDAPVGGGVDAVEEQELMDDERDDEDDED